jgi:hypothetical protein
MAVLLSGVSLRSAVIRLVDFGGFNRPVLGGPVQRINRLGSRYAIDVELPPLREEPDGRLFSTLLERALSEGALFAFPQPGLRISPPGNPVIDGAVLSGTSITMRGLTPNCVIRAGQYFSVIHDGRRYLYRAATEAWADDTGDVAVTVTTLLRDSLSDGDTVELGKPMIEGWVEAPQYGMMREPFTTIQFTITEAA